MTGDPVLDRLECLELDVATLRCEVDELRRFIRAIVAGAATAFDVSPIGDIEPSNER